MSQSSDDPFAASSEDSSSGYSPDKFYTRATNGQGRHTNVRDPTGNGKQNLAVPPAVVSAIAALVASQRIPEYRTTGDFLRDALVHQLARRQNELEQGRFGGVISAYIALADAEHEAHISNVMRETISIYDETLGKERDPERIQHVLDRAQSAMPSLTPFYQAELQRVIDRYRVGAPRP